jgi:hypothetical protein
MKFEYKNLLVSVGWIHAGLFTVFLGDYGVHLICKRSCWHFGIDGFGGFWYYGLGPVGMVVWSCNS